MAPFDRDPPFPIELGPVSNGEYLPKALSPFAREVQRRTLVSAQAHARRLGVDRRRFLMGLGGAATMLLTLGACSKERSEVRGDAPGGTFRVPSSAPLEPDSAADALVGPADDVPEFVFDVQTHFLDYAGGGTGGEFGLAFPQASCGLEPATACFGIDIWAREVFANSMTSMAVISALPILADPHPQDHARMALARDALASLCGDGRIVLHGQANPNVGDLSARLDGMRAVVDDYSIGAWKLYTHVGDPPWSLDDHDPDGAPVGAAFLAAVEEIGPPVVCVHKGFGSPRWASPIDVGPAAVAHPGISFVVYHSGFESDVREGPYVEGDPHRGIDRLIETVAASGIAKGSNVYAELGSTWFLLMRDPDAAAHALGKLLLHVGEDNILWGTDSIWYGSPQSQIDAFRTFEISDEFQERFGYPPLSTEAKRKILGANAARLYGRDPIVDECRPSTAELEEMRVAAGPPRTYGPTSIAAARAMFAEHAVVV